MDIVCLSINGGRVFCYGMACFLKTEGREGEERGGSHKLSFRKSLKRRAVVSGLQNDGWLREGQINLLGASSKWLMRWVLEGVDTGLWEMGNKWRFSRHEECGLQLVCELEMRS